ncbi:unnamed protein product [Citrullus colocynthis]|uniref:Uncharacterized protein n=1 Tax=Citrullus colocynthis TaxID=252529 RepID=A0ABP0Y8I2_9ROSI
MAESAACSSTSVRHASLTQPSILAKLLRSFACTPARAPPRFSRRLALLGLPHPDRLAGYKRVWVDFYNKRVSVEYRGFAIDNRGLISSQTCRRQHRVDFYNKRASFWNRPISPIDLFTYLEIGHQFFTNLGIGQYREAREAKTKLSS